MSQKNREKLPYACLHCGTRYATPREAFKCSERCIKRLKKEGKLLSPEDRQKYFKANPPHYWGIIKPAMLISRPRPMSDEIKTRIFS